MLPAPGSHGRKLPAAIHPLYRRTADAAVVPSRWSTDRRHPALGAASAAQYNRLQLPPSTSVLGPRSSAFRSTRVAPRQRRRPAPRRCSCGSSSRFSRPAGPMSRLPVTSCRTDVATPDRPPSTARPHCAMARDRRGCHRGVGTAVGARYAASRRARHAAFRRPRGCRPDQGQRRPR